MVSQITSLHEIHNDVEVLLILESVEHIDNKPMSEGRQELPLINDRLDTPLAHHSALESIYMALLISFMANSFPVGRCSTFHTLPNPPLPTMLT